MIITIDVEALPLRSASDHVERLIWGRFQGQEMGVRRMISIANRHGKPLSFFVDLCEVVLYPRALDEVAQTILSEGHDLQLHAHPDILPPDFWSQRNLSCPAGSLSLYGQEQANVLLQFLIRAAGDLGQTRPVAYRGGAFRYNHGMLNAMAANQLELGFNYKFRCAHQANSSENLPVFRWSNGITEFPMSLLEFPGHPRAFEFSSTSSVDFGDLDLVHAYMDRFFAELGPDSVLILLMHSWSLLWLNPANGYFEYKDDVLAQQFARFLGDLGSDIEVISASQAGSLLNTGAFRPQSCRDIDQANRFRYGCAEKPANTKGTLKSISP